MAEQKRGWLRRRNDLNLDLEIKGKAKNQTLPHPLFFYHISTMSTSNGDAEKTSLMTSVRAIPARAMGPNSGLQTVSDDTVKKLKKAGADFVGRVTKSFMSSGCLMYVLQSMG